MFRLFVTLGMYQARRDVLIMEQQRTFSSRAAAGLTSTTSLCRSIGANPCPKLLSAELFDRGCSVRKTASTIDFRVRPGSPRHVKDATALFNRMGELGKLPTSASSRSRHRERVPAGLFPAGRQMRRKRREKAGPGSGRRGW